MKMRLPSFIATIIAACGSDLLTPWPGSSVWGWGNSPGTDAPKYNQRKASKAARRVGRKVSR